MLRIVSLLENEECLDAAKGGNVHLQLGYFEMAAADAKDGLEPFSRFTLQYGLELAARLKQRWPGTRVQYCTLVNDLGQVCGENACSIEQPPASASLEDKLARVRDVLGKSGIPAANHSFFYEKNLKNRGLRALTNLLASAHPNLQQVEDDDGSVRIMLRTRPTQSIHLATRRGASLIGKCPIIMGTFYREAVALLAHRFYRDSRPSLVVDLCHLIDKDKVQRGVEVFRALSATARTPSGQATPPVRLSIVPVFMDDAAGGVFPQCTKFN